LLTRQLGNDGNGGGVPRPLSEIEALTRPDGGAQFEVAKLAEITEALRMRLAENAASGDQPDCLVRRAISHSLGAPGKLVRGQLVLLTASAWGSAWRPALELARAVEIVHAASLVIDDLPAMDNAALRRGSATVHRVYGEATAILAAVAMLAEAFEAVAGAEVSAEARVRAVEALSRSVGPDGMTGGQQLDIAGGGKSKGEISTVHGMKTGSLFAASAEIGTIAAGIDGPRRWLMSDFGMLLGKAFQEFDDLADRYASAERIGKDTGKDEDKATMVAVMGGQAAERHALEQVVLALECLHASGARETELESFALDLVAKLRARYLLPAGEVG
jgi:geranylgeranyl diphosphate synthase type II